MRITGQRIYKNFRHAAPGELVSFELHQSMSLGIVITQGDDDNEPLVAALIDKYERHPRLIKSSSEDDCISYGREWCIEPFEDAESFPWPHEVNQRSGLLALTEHGWAMTVGASSGGQSGRFNFQWLLLEKLRFLERFRRAAYFSHWKIWTSLDERNVRGAKPILEFEAKPPPRQG